MRSPSAWPVNSSSPATSPAPSSSNFQQLVPPPVGRDRESNSSRSNVFKLLALRELSPRTRRSHKRFWGKASSYCVGSSRMKSEFIKDARQEIQSWAEAESLLHLSPKYCPLLPPPKSTIAAAFSPDGKTLASTHGDHTVKIIDCRNGSCLKVLSGHRRTPWVVRFHPMYPDVVASGSLDHEVRLWDTKTAECIGSRDFYRPIASIAFHAQGEILAVASGHKLYIWYYNRKGDASSPTIILKTRRSLRAVHFHPHAAPFLLTAEVNDLDSSDPPMTLATSPGYLNYPPPTIYFADANSTHRSNSGNGFPHSVPFLIRPLIGRSDTSVPSQQTDVDMSSYLSQQNRESSASVRLFSDSTPSGYELVSYPVRSPVREETQSNALRREMGSDISQRTVDVMETNTPDENRSNQFFPFGDPVYWELPFLQGQLIGQSQAVQHATHSQNGGPSEGLSTHSATENLPPVVPPVMANAGSSRVAGRSITRQQSPRSGTRPETGFSDGLPPDQSSSQRFMSQVQSEVATASFAAAAAAELPCTVKLRIWYHDMKNPCVPLDTGRCRLTIPHTVLCSEMGAHFSPCGRFLAVCVACFLPNIDAELGLQSQVRHDVTGASASPTRHPISAHQIMYELRVYSIEEATFGSVIASRAIRAAHCLTSIQFSPTSEHLLLAYGRRHSSLLKSVVIDGDITVPIYTILEIYKVSNMELVRVLPSAEDEVNVACFHPSVGGGFVYGTKEGKLRILQCNIPHGFHNDGPWASDGNIFEMSMSRSFKQIDDPQMNAVCQICQSYYEIAHCIICSSLYECTPMQRMYSDVCKNSL